MPPLAFIYKNINKYSFYLYLSLILLLYAYTLYASWWKWGDLFIDFGREIYVAWQVSEGAILYKDIFYHYGPLASIINGSLMYIFGPSLSSIFYPNIILILIFIISYYKIISKEISHTAAFFTLLPLLLSNVFAHPGMLGIYNFISPYSYDIIYGFYILSILALLILHSTKTLSCTLVNFIIGVLLGLTFLTKPEIIISSNAIVLFHIIYCSKKPHTNILKIISLISAGTLISLSVFFVYFLIKSDTANALFAVTRAIFAIFQGSSSDILFIKKVMGIDNIIENILSIIASFSCISILYISTIKAYQKTNRYLCISKLIIITATLAISLMIDSKKITHGLPLIIALLTIITLSNNPKNILLTLLLIWSFTFSIKIFFSYIIFHYGFVLTVPALMGLVVYIFSIKHPYRTHVIAILITPILIISIGTYKNTLRKYSNKETAIEYLHNKIYSNNENVSAFTTLFKYVGDWLINNSAPNDTLYVIPEGLLLNFMLNRESGQPYTALGPHEWLLYGGESILESFQKSPPTYIYYVFREDENDWGYFGQREHYGLAFMNWVREDYDIVIKINEDPSLTGKFGAVLYQHKSKRLAIPNPIGMVQPIP